MKKSKKISCIMLNIHKMQGQHTVPTP